MASLRMVSRLLRQYDASGYKCSIFFKHRPLRTPEAAQASRFQNIHISYSDRTGI